jgi:hypothetical protein
VSGNGERKNSFQLNTYIYLLSNWHLREIYFRKTYRKESPLFPGERGINECFNNLVFNSRRYSLFSLVFPPLLYGRELKFLLISYYGESQLYEAF